MNGVVVIDTNLMLLLVVGLSSKSYIGKHKRLYNYTVDDYELLCLIISNFSEIVVLPHICTEVSNLSRHIENPARTQILNTLKELISVTTEIPIPSVQGAVRDEFSRLGLTDSMILHLCSIDLAGIAPTLITVDTKLADSANSLGYEVIDYKEQYQSH